MRSLRGQLVLGTAAGTAAVLLICGVLLDTLLRRTMWAEFDAALAAKARALAVLLELTEEGLESELAAAPLPEFEPSARAEYYQLWLPGGRTFARSPSLGAGELERPAVVDQAPVFRTLRLPDGRPGRAVALAVAPRREFEVGPAVPELIVTLAVARDTRGLEATLAHVRKLLLGVGVAAVLLSAGVLAWVVHRNLRPVARLSGQIAAVGERELHQRIDGAGVPAELVPVVERLNDLLARLAAAFARERRFTGNVAHELRTPLAGLRVRLELALTRERPPEDYRSALRDCLAVHLELQRLVENLLHLARADAGQLEFCWTTVDVAAVLRECWQAVEARAAARGLTSEWFLDADGCVPADEPTLRVILRNLLDNAVTYADTDGPLRATLSADRDAAILTLSNRTHLAPADAERVFDRFWRADPSRQQAEAPRCGLGLSLCRELADRLGGSVTAEVRHEGRFVVTLHLPRARPPAGARD